MDVNINEDLLTIMMLYSLLPGFENFRVSIKSRDTLPKPDEFKIKIIEESDARHGQRMSTSNEPESTLQEEAYYASCKISKQRGNIFKRKHHTICTNCWKKKQEFP